ncbi:uncharacterized protein LOC136032299 isoform X2 [Artemia franciscana]|uniref:uncharacterized protein LOC136032299 isoform X2 n=1 Tax=Artemia franciscana TaxID=6661 RepID=UPI0032DADD17
MSEQERQQVSGLVHLGSSFVVASGSKNASTLQTVKNENIQSGRKTNQSVNPEPDLVPLEIQEILKRIEKNDETNVPSPNASKESKEIQYKGDEEVTVNPPPKRKLEFKIFRPGEVNSAYLSNILDNVSHVSGDIHPLEFESPNHEFNYLSLTRAGKKTHQFNFDPFNHAKLPDSWIASKVEPPSTENGDIKGTIEETKETLDEGVAITVERRQVLEQYWNVVKENPFDFTGWCHLLEHVETIRDINIVRGAYNAFLPLYPYCFAYWKRYSDMERKLGNDARAVEVLEKGLEAVPFSTDLWLSLVTLTGEIYKGTEEKDDFMRWRYEQAIAASGSIFTADSLWESYMNWEAQANRLDKVTALYRRVLKIPTRLYNKHFDNFVAHVRDHHPIDILGQKEYEKRREIASKTVGIPYKETFKLPRDDRDPAQLKRKVSRPESKLCTTMKEKIVADIIPAHKKTGKEVDTIWKYEDKIRRPYFHVKPLDKKQLKNWQEYLDFEISRGNYSKIIMLFERCLVPCANYEEFWSKYANFVEKWIGKNPVEEAERENEKTNGKKLNSKCQMSKEMSKEQKGEETFCPGKAEIPTKANREVGRAGIEDKLIAININKDVSSHSTVQMVEVENDRGRVDQSVQANNSKGITMDNPTKFGTNKSDIMSDEMEESLIKESDREKENQKEGERERMEVTINMPEETVETVNQERTMAVGTGSSLAEESEENTKEINESLGIYFVTAESVRNVYRRGCLIHCLKKPRLRLLWSLFEESQGNLDWARTLIEHVIEQYPSLLEARCQLIELEIRCRNHERVIQLYEYHLPHTWKISKEMGSWLSIKYSRYLYKILQKHEKALQVLRTALKKDKSNSWVYQHLIDFCHQRQPIDIKGVQAAFTLALLSKDLKLADKCRFAKRKMEFSRDFGDIKSYRSSMLEYHEYEKLHNATRLQIQQSEATAKTKVPPETKNICSVDSQLQSQPLESDQKAASNSTVPQQMDSGMMQYFHWLQEWYQQVYGSSSAYPPPNLPNFGTYGYGETDYSHIAPYQMEQIKQTEAPQKIEAPNYSRVPPSEAINITIPKHLKKDPDYQEWETDKFKKYAELESKGWPKDHTTIIHVTCNNPMPVPPQKPVPPRKKRRWFRPGYRPPPFPREMKLRMIDKAALSEVQYLDLAGADKIYPQDLFPREFEKQNTSAFFHNQDSRLSLEFNKVPRPNLKWFNPNFRKQFSREGQVKKEDKEGNCSKEANLCDKVESNGQNEAEEVKEEGELHAVPNEEIINKRKSDEKDDSGPPKVQKVESKKPIGINNNNINRDNRRKFCHAKTNKRRDIRHISSNLLLSRPFGFPKYPRAAVPLPLLAVPLHNVRPPLLSTPVPDVFSLPLYDELPQISDSLSYSPCINVPDWFVSNGGKIIISQSPEGISSISFSPKFLTDHGIQLLYSSLRNISCWVEKNAVPIAWLGPCAYRTSKLQLEKYGVWPSPVCDLIYRLISETSHQWNSCLAYFLQSGYSFVDWSEELPASAGKDQPVALVLLGSMRIIEFQKCHGRKDFMRFPMFPGSCIILEGKTAKEWTWQIPKDPKSPGDQVLLTFFVMCAGDETD